MTGYLKRRTNGAFRSGCSAITAAWHCFRLCELYHTRYRQFILEQQWEHICDRGAEILISRLTQHLYPSLWELKCWVGHCRFAGGTSLGSLHALRVRQSWVLFHLMHLQCCPKICCALFNDAYGVGIDLEKICGTTIRNKNLFINGYKKWILECTIK